MIKKLVINNRRIKEGWRWFQTKTKVATNNPIYVSET